MPEFTLYHWQQDKVTCFEDMLSYAWYLYIEDKDDDIRREASQCLKLIKEAAQLAGLAKKPLEQVCTKDLHAIKSVFADVIIDPKKAKKSLLYLLKFIHLLNGRNLIAINIIDVAAAL